MTSSGYLPHILHPTRITEYTSTIIDNIYTNNSKDNSIGGNILVQFAHHLAQLLSIEKTFLEDIATQDWNTDNHTNIYFNNFLTTLETCIDKHAPMKKLNRKQIKKLSKPWINNFILKLISHRERLFIKTLDK